MGGLHHSSSGSPLAPASARRLGSLIGELMGLIHRRSAGDTLKILSEAGLTMAQLVALHLLQHGGARSVSGVAGALRLSPAATSHLIDRLVQAGYVERREDPEDRRAKRVAITQEGVILSLRVETERTREFADVFGRLSPSLRRRMVSALTRVNRELQAPERALHSARAPSLPPRPGDRLGFARSEGRRAPRPSRKRPRVRARAGQANS